MACKRSSVQVRYPPSIINPLTPVVYRPKPDLAGNQVLHLGQGIGQAFLFVCSTYDSADLIKLFGRLKSVTEDLTPQIANDPTLNTNYGYAFNGSLSRTDLPSGIIESYQYDTMGRLDVLTHYAAASTPNDLSNNPRVAKFDYAVRADGKRTSLQRGET